MFFNKYNKSWKQTRSPTRNSAHVVADLFTEGVAKFGAGQTNARALPVTRDKRAQHETNLNMQAQVLMYNMSSNLDF